MKFILLVPLATFISLFLRWEPSTETWGYWLFSRILTETGRFVVTDRSPLYTIYLIPFRIFPFPYSIIIENIVTTSILLIALIIFFKKYIGIVMSTFASVLWLPFIQTAEPPVQKLALALALTAVMIRERLDNKYTRAWFYSLLGFAYLFRVTYAPIILFFAVFDLVGRKSLKIWPLTMPILIFFLFTIFQSDHKWNATTFSSYQWFPYNAKTLAITGLYNRDYIQENYQAIAIRDIYFTNSQLFGNETTFIGALKVNPQFLFSHFHKYFFEFFITANDLTLFKRGLKLFLLICLGAIIGAKGNITRLLFVCIIGSLIAISTLSRAAHRYLILLIPVYVVSMAWYGKMIGNRLTHAKISSFVGITLTILLFILSSGGTTLPIIKDSIAEGEIRLMQSLPTSPTSYSLTASFGSLSNLASRCRGIMSLEYPFIAAFMDIPINDVYDVFEIPPFGTYGNSEYDDLHQDRINCLFVSNNLINGEGQPTNHRIRYESYIRPYEYHLLSLGGKRYDIPDYGYAVILPK